MERIFAPEDQNRVAEYGPVAESIQRVKKLFDDGSSAPDTPGPEDVAEAFVRLIRVPAVERPFRTVPTAAIQQLLEPYNALAETIRDLTARTFKAPELTVFQQSGSTRAQGCVCRENSKLSFRGSSPIGSREQQSARLGTDVNQQSAAFVPHGRQHGTVDTDILFQRRSWCHPPASESTVKRPSGLNIDTA